MKEHVKNIITFLTVVMVIFLIAWYRFQIDARARIKRESIAAINKEFNDSVQRSPVLPFEVNHYKYGPSVVTGSIVQPIDDAERECWNQQFHMWNEYYYETERKVNAIKNND